MSEETELVVRCEVDGVLKHKGQDELLSVKALNEFDPKLTGQCYPPEHCMSWHLPSLVSYRAGVQSLQQSIDTLCIQCPACVEVLVAQVGAMCSDCICML